MSAPTSRQPFGPDPPAVRGQPLLIPQWSCSFGSGVLLSMTSVTRMLSRIESGDPSAAEQLLPLVYDEPRRLAAVELAREKPGQTLQEQTDRPALGADPEEA